MFPHAPTVTACQMQKRKRGGNNDRETYFHGAKPNRKLGRKLNINIHGGGRYLYQIEQRILSNFGDLRTQIDAI